MPDPPGFSGIPHRGPQKREQSGLSVEAERVDRQGRHGASQEKRVIEGGRKNGRSPGMERADPDRFLLAVSIVDAAVSAEPPGLSQADPSGRLVTGAGESGGIHEGLGQKNRMVELTPPVGGETPQAEAQNPGGEMGRAGFWQDQKSLVVGDVAETAELLRGSPSDPAVPVAALERGGSPPQKGHPFGAGEGDVFEGFPDQTAEA